MGTHKNRRPRTLIIDLSVRSGGASVRGLGLMKALPAGQAALACLEDAPVWRQASSEGLEVYTLGRHKADPRIATRLIRVVRTKGFHVLDAQNSQSKFWGSIAAQCTGAVLVSTLNSWYESEYGGTLKGRFYQMIERLTTVSTGFFIVVSSEINDRLIDEGVPKEAIAFIPNAVENDLCDINADRNWLCATFDVPHKARVCCAVGRLVEAKGYDCLIRSIAKIKDKNLHCLIVGDGHLRPELAALISQLGEKERIHFLGFRERSEVLKIIKTSDIFLMPSLTEGTPIALLEAAGLSRPIVASSVGGIPDIMTHGEHALLIQRGDEAGLADAIDKLYAQPDLARRLGRQAHKHITQNFSLNAQAESTQYAYQMALSRSRQGLG